MKNQILVSVPTEFSSNLLYCKVEPNNSINSSYNPAQLTALQEEMKRQKIELMKSQKMQENFMKYKMNLRQYKEQENNEKILADNYKNFKINNKLKAKEYNENLRKKMKENEANKQRKKLKENLKEKEEKDECKPKEGINRIKSFSFKEMQNIIQATKQNPIQNEEKMNENSNNQKGLSSLILSQINNDNSHEIPLTENTLIENFSLQESQNRKEESKIKSPSDCKMKKEIKEEFGFYDEPNYEQLINENLQKIQNFRNSCSFFSENRKK